MHCCCCPFAPGPPGPPGPAPSAAPVGTICAVCAVTPASADADAGSVAMLMNSIRIESAAVFFFLKKKAGDGRTKERKVGPLPFRKVGRGGGKSDECGLERGIGFVRLRV